MKFKEDLNNKYEIYIEIEDKELAHRKLIFGLRQILLLSILVSFMYLLVSYINQNYISIIILSISTLILIYLYLITPSLRRLLK